MIGAQPMLIHIYSTLHLSHIYHVKSKNNFASVMLTEIISCTYLPCHNNNVAMIKASPLWCNNQCND